MVKSSIDDTQGGNGEVLVDTGTGGGPQITSAVIAAGARAQQSPTLGGAMAALVSWFAISTGTNSVSADTPGAQVTAGGAGSVIADGATAVSTNSAGAVNVTGDLAPPWRTPGGAFSDQMPIPWASRFVFNTGTDTIHGHRGAQIAGGAGSVIATGAATVTTNGAGAVNTTTGALAQFSRTAANTFSDQMLIQRDFASESGTDKASGILINATTGGTINFGTGAQIASAGAVIADGAAAVNTNSAGAVNVYEKRGSNIYGNVVVVGTTCLMIGAGLGIVVCSSKNLGTGVVVAMGFSLKRKVRWWASRLIKNIKDELD